MTAGRVVSSSGADGPVVCEAVACTGEYFFTSADIVAVTNTNIVRNTNTVPIPSTIRFRASDSNCPDSTLSPLKPALGGLNLLPVLLVLSANVTLPCPGSPLRQAAHVTGISPIYPRMEVLAKSRTGLRTLKNYTIETQHAGFNG